MVDHRLCCVVELRSHGSRGTGVIEEDTRLDIGHGVGVQGLGCKASVDVGTGRSGEGRGRRVQRVGGLTIGIV